MKKFIFMMIAAITVIAIACSSVTTTNSNDSTDSVQTDSVHVELVNGADSVIVDTLN